jgi:hypothetical protein
MSREPFKITVFDGGNTLGSVTDHWDGRFTAALINGRDLGQFDSEEDASRAVREAAARLAETTPVPAMQTNHPLRVDAPKDGQVLQPGTGKKTAKRTTIRQPNKWRRVEDLPPEKRERMRIFAEPWKRELSGGMVIERGRDLREFQEWLPRREFVKWCNSGECPVKYRMARYYVVAADLGDKCAPIAHFKRETVLGLAKATDTLQDSVITDLNAGKSFTEEDIRSLCRGKSHHDRRDKHEQEETAGRRHVIAEWENGMAGALPEIQEMLAALEAVIGPATAVADDLRQIPAALRLRPLLDALTESELEQVARLMKNPFVCDAVDIAMRDFRQNREMMSFADIRDLFGLARDAFHPDVWREMRQDESRNVPPPSRITSVTVREMMQRRQIVDRMMQDVAELPSYVQERWMEYARQPRVIEDFAERLFLQGPRRHRLGDEIDPNSNLERFFVNVDQEADAIIETESVGE